MGDLLLRSIGYMHRKNKFTIISSDRLVLSRQAINVHIRLQYLLRMVCLHAWVRLCICVHVNEGDAKFC